MDPAARQLDTSVEIITPENIAFRYRLAGPFRRLPAFLLDVIIEVAAGFAVLSARCSCFARSAWGAGHRG